MKQVLVTGASGLLGRQVFKVFNEDPGFNTTGQAHSRAAGNLKSVDLTDETQLQQLFASVKPDVVIHCAAERRPDIVEGRKEQAKKLNEDATLHICQLAKEYNAFVVFMSTDYVFDGTDPPYHVDSTPNPLNAYGISKLEGEKLVMKASQDNIVLRVPILYGQIEYLDESAVTLLFNKVKHVNEECLMDAVQTRYPTHTSDVAAVLRDLVHKRLEDPSVRGIFHWSDKHNMTKYEMAMTMAQVFKLPTSHIQPNKEPSPGAKRPQNAHIETSRLLKLGINHSTPFTEGIKQSLQMFNK